MSSCNLLILSTGGAKQCCVKEEPGLALGLVLCSVAARPFMLIQAMACLQARDLQRRNLWWSPPAFFLRLPTNISVLNHPCTAFFLYLELSLHPTPSFLAPRGLCHIKTSITDSLLHL